MVGGWLENEFLKKTTSPKFGLESQLGTSDLELVNHPYFENEDGLVIGINSLSDSGAGLALRIPEFMWLPLTRLSDGTGYLLGST